MRFLVEGWLSAPHSYTTVNQFQCLALLGRSGLQLFHREQPLAHGWQPIAGQLDSERSRRLAQIPAPDGDPVDGLLRIDSPYRLEPDPIARRSLVFATAEFGKLHHEYWQWMGCAQKTDKWAVAGGDRGAVVLTPSAWSRQGLIHSGAAPDQVVVLPHGVDPQIYHPLAAADRSALRRAWGWEGCQVLLNVGGTIPRKGGDLLILALGAVMERSPQLRWVLKANDAVYGRDRGRAAWVKQVRSLLPSDRAQRLLDRTIYLNKFLSYQDMAKLYQAADGYVSPYRAEGFNLPVLEAIGCGLPVICTQGGPTDEFTDPAFTLPIASQLIEQPVQYADGVSETVWMWEPDCDALIDCLETWLDRPQWHKAARAAGPAWVQSRFTWDHAVDKLLSLLIQQP